MRFALCMCLFVTLLPGQVRPLPPPGVPIPPADRAELEAGVAQLGRSLDALRAAGRHAELLPDVLIYHKAVDWALRYDGFFKAEEAAKARELLAQGQARADALAEGRAPWTTATGLVVRGYISKIDQSVQPYGLVIPSGVAPRRGWRLDTWFHGRNETLSEVNFLHDRQRSAGEFTPAGAIVIHLYGRYCNANKFAGEVDLFEALDAVKRQYPIDENRIVLRGFSMGGAATWHLAAHHAGLWAAAAPGAGFAETAEYRGIFRQPGPYPPDWEQKLWRLYDATAYALNLFHCPTVAYSGELDRQKQAADIMAREMAAEGMNLAHVIGPKTEHRYHPDSKIEISRRIDALAERGREPYPSKVRFTTWTLAYNRMKWVTIDGLGRHWERARIEADIVNDHTLEVRTTNVTAFTLEMGAGGSRLDPSRRPDVVIDGQRVSAPGPLSDRSWRARFGKSGSAWALAGSGEEGLRKRHGLQGPIDDAFLDRFVMVRPTGQPLSPRIGAWTEAEQARAIREWRRVSRGDALVRDDTAIDDAEIARSNLILWGDPSSNRVLARIAGQLPVRWTKDAVVAGKESFAAATHVPILIYPNPLNPQRYVVLNSGPTFREAHHSTNALQTPKLPDYAVVDITAPADARAPGRIARAGFFGERWEIE